jgi:transposase-like protein
VADWFPEQEEHHMLARFGATDTPTCPYCKNPMRLTKRKPHPKHGYEFELQTFTCGVCQHEIERDADILGEVLA